MKRVSFALAWALVFLSSLTLRAQDGALSVVSSGPQGETTTREQTNEMLNFFVHGPSSGALTLDEARETGLSVEELQGRSFLRILERRRTR